MLCGNDAILGQHMINKNVLLLTLIEPVPLSR